MLTINLEKENSAHEEELEIAKRQLKAVEEQARGNDNEIISNQKELINDLSRRVKLLQEEINLMSRQHHDQLMKAKNENLHSYESKRSLASRFSTSKLRQPDVNMTLDYGDTMPPLHNTGSRFTKSAMKKKKMLGNFLPSSSNDKLFTLKTDEDREIMNNIDQLGNEELRIQMLKALKNNHKLQNNIDALKEEMNMKLNALKNNSDNTKTVKFGNAILNSNPYQQDLSSEDESINNPLALERTNELKKENQEAYQRISALEEELKAQEKFFRNKLQKQRGKSNQFNEESLLKESKFVNLMDKLNAEQNEIQFDKKRYEAEIKEMVGAATQKVKELEDELEFRSNHYKTETEKLRSQNKMLKETGSISKKEANDMRAEQRGLQNQIDHLKDENKEIKKKLKQKEIEIMKALKQIQELTDALNSKSKDRSIEERKQRISPMRKSRDTSKASGILKKK